MFLPLCPVVGAPGHAGEIRGDRAFGQGDDFGEKVGNCSGEFIAAWSAAPRRLPGLGELGIAVVFLGDVLSAATIGAAGRSHRSSGSVRAVDTAELF